MHARDTIHIDAPVETVDAVTLPPDAWRRYFVGMSAPHEVVGDGGPGTTVAFSVSPPRPASWRPRVWRAYRDLADGNVHWRGEFAGGNGGWETWDLVPEAGEHRSRWRWRSSPPEGRSPGGRACVRGRAAQRLQSPDT